MSGLNTAGGGPSRPAAQAVKGGPERLFEPVEFWMDGGMKLTTARNGLPSVTAVCSDPEVQYRRYAD
jgi:hypothetical protein